MINLNNISEQMKAIVEAMKDESLTDERFAELEKEYNELEAAVKRDEKLRGIISGPGPMTGKFSNLGEFVNAVVDVQVRHNPLDSRLAELRATQSMGEGSSGGFMIPQTLKAELLQIQPQDAIFRPRATVIPADSSYPDAELTMPILAQGASENMFGGIVVKGVAEGGEKNATDFELKEHSWIPHEVAGYITCTDKLIRNWSGSSAVISKLLRNALFAWEDTQFLLGDGVAKPQGIIHSGARIDVARNTANQINWADIRDMLGRFKFGKASNAVWVTSPTCVPQLLDISDPNTSGTNIWAMDAKNPMPGTILGIPVMFNDRSPALGSRGDLILVDPSYYVIKDGSGPTVAASSHVYFTSNKTVIKIFFNVDGSAWLDEPLPLEGSTTDTVSPFVILE